MPEQNLNPDAMAVLARIETAVSESGYNCTCSLSPDNVSIDKDWLDHNLRELKRLLLSALPAQPDTVDSVEELEALPPCSVIVDKHGDAGLIEYGHVKFAETAKLPMAYVAKRYLPATVIYRPVEG